MPSKNTKEISEGKEETPTTTEKQGTEKKVKTSIDCYNIFTLNI